MWTCEYLTCYFIAVKSLFNDTNITIGVCALVEFPQAEMIIVPRRKSFS